MATALQIAARVSVDAEPEQVWQTAVDWPRQREWMWGTNVHGGHGTGAEVTGRTGIGPVAFTDTMIITDWKPPRRCVVEHTGRVVRGEGVLEVTPAASGSQLEWIERLQLPFPATVGRLAARIIRPLAQWGLDSSLRRFARLVTPPPPAPREPGGRARRSRR